MIPRVSTQSSAADNEVRVNRVSSSSSSASATRAVNHRNSIPVVSGIGDDRFKEEKPKIDGFGEGVIGESIINRGKQARSAIPVPSLISISTATAEASSVNLAQSLRVEGAGETVKVEQAERVNLNLTFPAMTPVLRSQPGFARFATGHTPIFSGINNLWGPQPVGNPYQYHCFPYSSNMRVSGATTPNLKRKVEVSRNSCNPQRMEGQLDHIPAGFYQDSVFHTNFVPVQAVFQNPLFPAVMRGPPLNYSLYAPVTKNQEMSAFATSHSPRNCSSLGGSASVPLHKRKAVRPSCSSGTSRTVLLDANNNANSEPSAKCEFPPLREHKALEATPNLRTSLVSSSSDPQSGYLPSASSYRPEDDKDINGRDWIVLVQKELRNTDVGNLGRIVLPKKDAEANLPPLVAKDGLILQMEDMTFSIKWKFKYRYWPNNKSRMYVMENTGDFVRTHNLQTGDFFIVYKEESSGKYIARGKKGMRLLHIGDSVELRDNGRAEEGETAADGQFGLDQGTSGLSDVLVQSKDEHNSLVTTGEPFDFE